MKKPLTAQEALDREGYLVIACALREPNRAVVTLTEYLYGHPPEGSQMVIVGEVSKAEAVEYVERIGWDWCDHPWAKYFYKAVAE